MIDLLSGVAHRALQPLALGTGGGLRLGLGLWLGGGQGGGGGPTPPTANQFGINGAAIFGAAYYNPATYFENLAYGDFWRGRPGDQSANAIYPYIDNNGDIASFEPGVTSYIRVLNLPLTKGQHHALTWTVVSGSPTVTVTGTVVTVTPVINSAGLIVFTATWAGDWPQNQDLRLTVTGGVINNIDCRRSDSSGNKTNPTAIWTPEYVTEMTRFAGAYIRDMDFANGTGSYAGTELSGFAFPWAKRATRQQRGGRPYRASDLTYGAGASGLRFAAKTYANNAGNILSGSLPDHWFGAGGDKIKVKINAASGGGTVTINQSGSGVTKIWEVEVTPATTDTTAALVRTRILANANAAAILDVFLVGDGSGAVTLPMASTNLANGDFGTNVDGIPIEWFIELCNLTGCKPYFTAPWCGNADYAQGLGTLISTTLNSASKPAIVGVGNEPWNYAQKTAGMIQTEGASLGYADNDIGRRQRQAERHKAFMEQLSLTATPGTDVIRALEGQTGGSANMSAMLGFTGVADVTDAGTAAPYWDGGQTTAAAAFAGASAAIESIMDTADTLKGVLDGAVKDLIFYEGGPHYTAFTDITEFQNFQRGALMKRYEGIYLAEIKRRFPDSPFMHYNQHSRIAIGGDAQAWGAWEYMGQPDVDAPKVDALFDARDGIFPAYFALDQSITVPGTTPYAGTPVTVTIPSTVYYQQGPIVYLWRANGGATAGTGAATATYTPAAGDIGKVLTCEITLTNGTTPYTYTSPATPAVSAATKFVFYEAADVSGGNITLPADLTDSNIFHLIGAGGNGASGSGSTWRNGGGGGAYASATITGLTPGGTVAAVIPAAGGGDTSIQGGTILAKGGANATNASGGQGAGGLASASTGSTKYDGGNGGTVTGTFFGGGGGGGAAGPSGAGKAGGQTGHGTGGGGGGSNGGSSTAGGNGASGVGGTAGRGGANTAGVLGGLGGTASVLAASGTDGGGGGGGYASSGFQAAGNGSQQPLWTETIGGAIAGPGGGGGGFGASGSVGQGGNGGGYGAGGGGGFTGTPGSGRPGIIVLEYQP